MVNKKIKVVARVEKDARNFFFVNMFYGFTDGKNGLETVYGIEDSRMIDTLIGLSHSALLGFPCGMYIGGAIIVYDTKDQRCCSGSFNDYILPNKIVVGTHPVDNFRDINYLARMISYMVKKNNMGEFFVQYEKKEMSYEEFLEFQKSLL